MNKINVSEMLDQMLFTGKDDQINLDLLNKLVKDVSVKIEESKNIHMMNNDSANRELKTQLISTLSQAAGVLKILGKEAAFLEKDIENIIKNEMIVINTSKQKMLDSFAKEDPLSEFSLPFKNNRGGNTTN